MECTCTKAGYCEKRAAYMTERSLQYCQHTSGLTQEAEEALLYIITESAKPTFINKAISFAKAGAQHILAGRPTCTDEQYNERVAICDTCDLCDKTNDTWNCKVCSCQIKDSDNWPSKARWSDQICPYPGGSKWPKIELPIIKAGEAGVSKGCCGK